MKSLITSVVRPQDNITQEKAKEMMDVEKETKKDEELAMKRLARTLSNEENKKKKTKASASKRKSLKRDLVVSSDSKSNVEADVLNIVPSLRKKIGGKKVLVNISTTPLDNMLFHHEESVKKWRFLCQRRSKDVESDIVPSLDKVAGEISISQVQIGASNWVPTNHSSSITLVLAKLIFQIGTKAKLNFGEHAFGPTLKHVDSYAVKLPIAFLCLITRIIFKKHPKILCANEIKKKKPGPLNLDYKLFVGSHVADIKMPRSHSHVASGSYSSGFKTTKEEVLHELMEMSNTLQSTIISSTNRKNKMDDFIKILSNKEEGEEEAEEKEENSE
ncbi:uncharacterized protein LOC127101818 [Lathyrus oleraceus]|uniref:uncharacterized protein LOC127101818 n=1 Tax=Pisum sativum TaxID=3888 RepID=UPI0021D054DF|nr:uncharacterized protein LOC127101818 [Pisum sativum]